MNVSRSAKDNQLARSAEEAIAGDPGWATLISELTGKFRNDYYAKDYIDLLHQASWHRPLRTISDAYAFAMMHAAIFSGSVAMFEIHVGSGPGADSDTDWNNRRLKTLPEPFEAHFHGGAGDQDGSLTWSTPIKATVTIGEDDSDVQHQSVVVLDPPFFVPLEVGYTEIATTFWHLIRDRALARWPYGHDKITVLSVVDDRLWNPRLGPLEPKGDR